MMFDIQVPPTEPQVAELCNLTGEIARRLAYQRDVLLAEVKRLERFEAAYLRLGKEPKEVMDFLMRLIAEEANGNV